MTVKYGAYTNHLMFYSGQLLFREGGPTFEAGCCCVFCDQCTGAQNPNLGNKSIVGEYMKISITGFVNNGCNGCNDGLNGVQWLPYNGETSNTCKWTCNFEPICSTDLNFSEVQIYKDTLLGGVSILVNLGNHFKWKKNFPTGFTCESLASTGFQLGPSDRITPGFTSECTWTNAGVHVQNVDIPNICCCCYGFCWPNESGMSKQFQVIITGINVTNPSTCSGCNELQATYILNHRDQCPETLDDNLINPGVDGRCWGGTFQPTCDYGYDRIRLALKRGGSDQFPLYEGDVIVTLFKSCTEADNISDRDCPEVQLCAGEPLVPINFNGIGVADINSKKCSGLVLQTTVGDSNMSCLGGNEYAKISGMGDG